MGFGKIPFIILIVVQFCLRTVAVKKIGISQEIC